MAKILVIDDERSVRNTLKEVLEYEGHQVEVAQDAYEGLEKGRNTAFDLIICDIRHVRHNDEHLLDMLQKEHPASRAVMTSREVDVDSVVDSIKRGAVDFLIKPLNLNRLLQAIKAGLDSERPEPSAAKGAKGEEAPDDSAPKRPHPVPKLIGQKATEMLGISPKILHVKRLIEKVAPSEARVLILGENGTGKELVAHGLHNLSMRCNEPFVEVNCAAIPSELIESELFGHEKGAFTSAIRQRKGKFEQADGGTLFLDEIGDMSLAAQAKVLRALQEGRISRVGSDKDIEVNVRVIAATNKNLREEIEKRNFREDLYHRLSVIVIRLPALSERMEDIPVLVEAFLVQICEEYGIPLKRICPDAIKELQSISWPGNVRQLRNVIERLVILSGENICHEDIVVYAQEVL
jgi:DNA-binding NtrC family response regulator